MRAFIFIYMVATILPYISLNSSEWKSHDYLYQGDLRKYFVYKPDPPKNQPLSIFVFLHGLEFSLSLNSPSFDKYRLLKHWADKYNFILVLPIGAKGLFPTKSNALAWGGDDFSQNEAFLFELSQVVAKEHGIVKPNLFLGGFSNGAYCASHLLQRGSSLWKGYWLIGGGNAIGIKKGTVKPKVFIEISERDKSNYPSVLSLYHHLIQNGWTPRKSIMLHRNSCGHCLFDSDFDTVWLFLNSQ